MKADLFAALLGVLTGCSDSTASVTATATLGDAGTSTGVGAGTDGDSTGTVGDTEQAGACALEVQPVAGQDPDLADLQVAAVGTYVGTLRWRDGEGLDVQYLGDTEPTPLALEVTAVVGAGRRVQSEPLGPCAAGPVLDPARCPCPDALEFDAQVRVSTADGVLDETAEATVRTLEDGEVRFTAFEVEVEVAAAAGSLDPSDFQFPGMGATLTLAMRFDVVGTGATRALLTVVRRTEDASVVQTIGEAAAVRSPENCGTLDSDATACALGVCAACACEGDCP